MIQGLRFWLLLSFSVISVLFLSSFYFLSKMYGDVENLEAGLIKLHSAKTLLLETFKTKEDLTSCITENSELFFIKDTSLFENEFYNKIILAKKELHYLNLGSFLKNNWLQKEIYSAIDSVDRYHQLFKYTVHLYRMKGFKNYGLEGKMRLHAHALLDINDQQIKYQSLILRRHEKDFILRKEIDYLHKFNSAIKTMINSVMERSSLNTHTKSGILSHLYFYSKYFNGLARIEKKLGVKNRFGLLHNEKITFENILYQLSQIELKLTETYTNKKDSVKKITSFLYMTLFFLLFISVLFFTNLITNSVKIITGVFSNYVNSGFSLKETGLQKSKIREFNHIYDSFSKMAGEINLYTNRFREKVEERTKEINQQKEEIQLQQTQIESQYQSLLKVYHELEEQRTELKQKNDEVQQSLRYAKHIQKALIPKQSEIKKYFSDVFVFSKAKDIISGDFHLAFPLKNNNEIIIIAADCTGHGAPGALISMLGINSIQKTIHLIQEYDPGKILHHVDRDFKQTLNSDLKKHEVYDGMDIAVLKFNSSTKELQFCNAKYYLLIIRNNKILTENQLKHSIGYHHVSGNEKVFITSNIILEKDDLIYLFSDGYHDQFGSAKNKKFKKKKLVHLLKDISSLSLKNQRLILKENFLEWKGKFKQTDDITIIGLKV